MLALATDERVRWEMNPHRQCPLSLDLFLSTSALVFFGVPNRGLRHEQLCPAVKGQPNESLVNEIQVDRESDPSPYLKLLGQRFKNCFEQHKPSVEVVAYYELHETPTLQVSLPSLKDVVLSDFNVGKRQQMGPEWSIADSCHRNICLRHYNW